MATQCDRACSVWPARSVKGERGCADQELSNEMERGTSKRSKHWNDSAAVSVGKGT